MIFNLILHRHDAKTFFQASLRIDLNLIFFIIYNILHSLENLFLSMFENNIN